MYADDVQLFIGSLSFADAVIKINNDLEKVQNWTTANDLRTNPPQYSISCDIFLNGTLY